METVAALNDFVREALPFYPNLCEEMLRVMLVHSGPVILPELGEESRTIHAEGARATRRGNSTEHPGQEHDGRGAYLYRWCFNSNPQFGVDCWNRAQSLICFASLCKRTRPNTRKPILASSQIGPMFGQWVTVRLSQTSEIQGSLIRQPRNTPFAKARLWRRISRLFSWAVL